MLKLILKVINFSGKYKAKILVAFLFSFLKTVLIKMPIYLGFFTILKFLEKKFEFQTFITLSFGIAISLILQIIFQNISDRLQASAGYMIMAEKRNQLGAHLRRMPMGYFTEGNLGKISSILSNDMVFIEENSMTVIANLMSDVFSQVIMIAFLFIINFWLGIAGLISVIAIILCGKLMVKSGLKDSKIRQEESEKLNSAVLDFTEGIGIIKTYNLFGKKSQELTSCIKSTCKTSIDFEEHQSPLFILLNICFGLASTALLALTIYLNQKSLIELSWLLGFILFVFDFLVPARTLYSQNARLTVMNSCMDRIDSLLNERELNDSGKSNFKDLTSPEIEFDNVCFGYGKNEILHNISFKIEKNKMLALVGASGSGKSTIANLIARFWDIQGGSIKIRGTDIRELPLSQVLNNISMVFQRVYLFQDTIYNNICMGRPNAPKEEVIAAAKKAQCYDFIMSLPNGFDTVIGAGGESLSGGEKQRISIARCILKDAPIVILDEATASVDAENEKLIQNAISELCKGKTLIVIAHRLNTIRNADKILVISEGKIAQEGTHSQLMQAEGIYKNFVTLRSNAKGWNANELS
ncbi:ABC transporter ATP-binding protein [Treponema pectinovorum]|uniref:ABC transporter ATP-binding protein n=1 Tax=Treponema pectinovorum TaxID=164 RepID=UPI0011C89BEE|nr:ABC transporter ATP-binding protein [Treponema pectinovorum]